MPLAQVVYVVLESQYQSSMTIASKRINAGQENVCVESVGYLLEELRNPDVLAAFKKVNIAAAPSSLQHIHTHTHTRTCTKAAMEAAGD
jgi:hypothetical protein